MLLCTGISKTNQMSTQTAASQPLETQGQAPSAELVAEIKEAIEMELRLTLARHFDNNCKLNLLVFSIPVESNPPKKQTTIKL